MPPSPALGIDLGGTKIEALLLSAARTAALGQAHRHPGRRLCGHAAGHRRAGRAGARRRRRRLQRRPGHAGQPDARRPDEERQLAVPERPAAAGRPAAAARPAGAAGQRCQLPGAVRSHRRRRRGRRGGVCGDPGHRHRRRHCGAWPGAERPERPGRRMGPQPAALGRARRRTRVRLLLRPARLHRDAAQRARAGARAPRTSAAPT